MSAAHSQDDGSSPSSADAPGLASATTSATTSASAPLPVRSLQPAMTRKEQAALDMQPHYSSVLVVKNSFLDTTEMTDGSSPLRTKSKASSDPTSSRSSSVSSSSSISSARGPGFHRRLRADGTEGAADVVAAGAGDDRDSIR